MVDPVSDPVSEAPARGKFITFEGSEGAGKSTNLAVVEAELQSRGLPCYVTREPGGTPMAEQIRELVLEPREETVDALTELLLMFAGRNQHVAQEIEPRLARGEWVLCDRFTDATYAYQGGGRGIAMDWIATLETWVQGDLRPDLTLYFDIPPAQGAARIADRELDRMEEQKLEFFNAVRAVYTARAEAFDHIMLIDASQDLASVQAQVSRVTCDVLDLWLKDDG